MKGLKRFGAALITMLALTAALTGTALAAEPEGISVQLNGKPVAFTDAVPEFSGERTFVPLRAVLEAMDARVDYHKGVVDIHRGGVDLSMVLGQNTASVTEDGQTRVITMDVAPYVKNNRTYVPVRFMAEAFGCSVGWDADAMTVVIVDVDALFGDATFDLMDNFSAYCHKQDAGNMALTGALALDMADQSGGNMVKPVSVKGSIDGITSDKGLQMNWNLSLSDPSKQLEDILPQGIAAALSDLKGEVRADLETGMVYLTLPAAITGGTEDSWHSLDFGAYQAQLLGTLNMTQLTQLEEAGIREALTATLKSVPVNDSQTGYETLALMASMYTDMLSDQAFVQNGNSYVAQVALEDVVDMTVTLTKRGNDVVAADIKMTCGISEDGETVAMTMTEHAAPDKVTVKMDMSMKSGGITMKLTLDMSSVPTSKAPVTTLPAGVQAIPMD